MAAPRVSVCEPWADEVDLCGECATYDFDVAPLDEMFQIASDILFELSGRRFSGTCEEIVRPCSQNGSTLALPTTEAGYAQLVAGRATNSYGCGSTHCGCARLQQISLGRYPVGSVTQVKIDGDVLASSAYRIDEHRYLVRVDGDAWPTCQDLSAAGTEDGTFQVTFTHGVEPPPAGRMAAAELACHLALACANDDNCGLPNSVQSRIESMNRQGITINTVDPTSFLADGLTGLRLVDLFLTAYPRRKRFSIYSPDVGPSVRRVGT